MSGSELLLVAVVAFILFGGKRMPEILRTWGRTVRDFRRAFEEMKRQMGLDEFDDIKSPPPPNKPKNIDKEP
jgi:sec-independent protein translocase protein TatA